MAMKDLLLRAASKPAGRVVEAPVRELVQEALQQGGFVDRAELDAVRKQLTQANADVADLTRRVDALAEQLQSIQVASDQHAAAAQAARADAAAARAALQALQGTPPAAPEPTPEPAAEPVAAPAPAKPADKRGRPSLTHKGCKVADCGNVHRSKGFCGRHYQQWRRGTLAGFVAPEGYVNADGAALRVNTKLQGSAFSWDGASLTIDGAPVDFETLE